MQHQNSTSELGSFIRQKRLQKKMTQRQLAHAAGFKSSSAVSDIENGFRYPGKEFLSRLADALGISIDELIEHDARMPVRSAQNLVRQNPAYAGVFRKITESARHMDPDELARRIDEALKPPKAD